MSTVVVHYVSSVAMEMVKTCGVFLDLRTFLPLKGIPRNNLARMKNCLQSRLNWPATTYFVAEYTFIITVPINFVLR